MASSQLMFSKGLDRFPRWRVTKNLPANAGDVRDSSSIPGSGGLLDKGMATHSSILAWGIPWTEEPGGL